MENSQESAVRYKSNKLFTQLIQISFGVYIIICIILAVLATDLLLLVDESLKSGSDVLEHYLKIADFHDYLLVTNLIINIFCGIFFLFWIYRANKNAHALFKESKFEFTPGWSVGCFFLPFFNLYWPYKAIKELWIKCVKISDNKGFWLLIVWWLGFLSISIVSRIARKFPLDTVSDLKTVLMLDLSLDLLGIIIAVLAIVIVSKITRAQKLLAMH